MKAILATALTAATMVATPALAASQVHHASQARAQYNAQYNTEMGVRPSNAVVSANRVLGQDPDPNIRTQLIHEGEVSAN